jgi:hypothetical protein
MPTRIRVSPEKYFPRTNSESFTGNVAIISMVPEFFSHAINPIVTAGMKKRKTKGMILKRDLRSD